MDTTLTILCLVLILYLGACVRQWNQLTWADREAEGIAPRPRKDR